MAIAHSNDTVSSVDNVPVRSIDMHDVRMALTQGWEDFIVKRGDLAFLGIIYPAVIVLGMLYAYELSLIPLIFPLLAGSILLGPAAATGFYEIARRRELGLDARWRHSLDVIRGPAAPSLLALTCVLAFIFIAWIATAWFIYSITVGQLVPQSVEEFIMLAFTTPEGWAMIIAGNGIGFGFAVVALGISVVSFPMLVDRPVGWDIALRTSVQVALENPFTVGMWGLIVVGLLILGSIPLFGGLGIVLPVLGYATWHLYTRAVER
ncbi:MAG: DUF2189 domain-containing protein [Sphingobium sp.]